MAPEESLPLLAEEAGALDELFRMNPRWRCRQDFFDLLRFVARFPQYSPFNGFLTLRAFRNIHRSTDFSFICSGRMPPASPPPAPGGKPSAAGRGRARAPSSSWHPWRR
ncbi:MAG: hypothetical protein MUC46_03980 [Desulfobacterales bacterium]|nr:hypothetical protein [Desulfobacterales bacterium]